MNIEQIHFLLDVVILDVDI